MSMSSTLHGVYSVLVSNMFVPLPYPEASLEGQTIIVTGSNQGLGLESSRHFLRLGVEKLIMGVRNLEKGESAKNALLASTKREESCIEVWLLDMDSYTSVKQFTSRAAALPRLDALLANAGIFTTTFSVIEDNERTVTTNVVSTFLLCMLLLPKLRQSAEQYGIVPRIVIPNSALHYVSPIKELDVEEGTIFTTLNDPKKADMGGRYPLSKLLVLYAVRELANQIKASKQPMVAINTPNPSFCKSQLVREVEGFGKRAADKLLARSTEMGSRALVNGVLSGIESNGEYLSNCHLQTPSSLVTNARGSEIQRRFFRELMDKLEKIVPGIQSNI